MQMQTYRMDKHVKITREMVKGIADSLAEEMSRKMYYKLLMLRFLPEIQAIEKKHLKALRGKEIRRFLRNDATK